MAKELDESLPWYELPQQPDTARVIFVSGNGEEQREHVVVDAPLDVFVKTTAELAGAITMKVSEDDGSNPYSSLSLFLIENDIIVPPDSPVRKLPGIKYELPPQPGTYRILWDLDHEEQLHMRSMPEHAREIRITFPIADVGQETHDSLQQRIQQAGDRGEHSKYGITLHLIQTVHDGEQYLYMGTPLIRALGVQPDPESRAYGLFQAVAKPPQRQ